jgi:hypothetical protein
MFTKQSNLLGTLQQQRLALPQLIYREPRKLAEKETQCLTYGLTPTPSPSASAAPTAGESRSSARGTSIFLTSESVGTVLLRDNARFSAIIPDRPAKTVLKKRRLSGSLLKLLSLITLVALSACAGFTQPMTDMELRAEGESCAKSALCRGLIEDRPPVLTLAVNDARLCETNARIAESILQREGIATRRFVVRLNAPRRGDFTSEAAKSQLLHTFVAANVNKRWYAVDNGALKFCDRVCRLSEALHGVELISGDTNPHVDVGNAAVAAR